MSVTALRPAEDAPPVAAAAARAAPPAAPVSRSSRVVAAVVVLAAVVVAGAGALLGVGTLRWIGVSVVLLFGVGAGPLQLSRGLSADAFVAGAFLLSLCVLLLGGLAMAQLPWWHPVGAFVAVASLTVVLHVLGLRRTLAGAWTGTTRPAGSRAMATDHPGARTARLPWRRHIDVLIALALVTARLHTRRSRAARRSRRGAALTRERLGEVGRALRAVASPSALCTVLGTGLWLTSALANRHIDPGMGGFVRQMPLTWFAGLALVVAGLITADHDRESDFALAVVALALAVTVTPSLVYDWPRSTSAAKHVGMIETIRHNHELFTDPEVYRSWAGFFAGMAWFCDAAGINDPMRMATWWPPVISILRVATFRFLAGRVITDPAYCWMATALAVLADPTGADYYSPQSVGLVIGIAIFGFAIHRGSSAGRGAVATWLVLLGGVAVAPSHQLSPFIIGTALAVLVVFGVVRPWWVVALVLLPAVAWSALHLDIVTTKLSWSQFGDTSNFRPPETVTTPGLQRLPIVRETVVALAAGVLLIAVAAAIVLLRERNAKLWGVALAAGAGAPIVAITAYGNEGIFRATIFAVPWLAVVAGGIFVTRRERDESQQVARATTTATVMTTPRSTRWRQRALLGVVTGSLLTTFLVAAFGLDASNVVRPGDLAAFRTFELTAQPDSVLLDLGQGNLPSRPTYRHGLITNVGRAEIRAPLDPSKYPTVADEVADITLRLRAYQGDGPVTRLYAIWSPTSSNFGWEYGIQTPADFALLREGFLASPYWRVVLSEGGTVLFQMVKAPPVPVAKRPVR